MFEKLRKSILRKDKYRCRICKKGLSQLNHSDLAVHHLVYTDDDNPYCFITCCLSCHYLIGKLEAKGISNWFLQRHRKQYRAYLRIIRRYINPDCNLEQDYYNNRWFLVDKFSFE